MYNKNLIPNEKDLEHARKFIKAIKDIEKTVNEFIQKRDGATEKIEQMKIELHELYTKIEVDPHNKNINQIKVKKKELSEMIGELESLSSIDIDKYIKSNLSSEGFQKLKSEAATEHTEWTTPLLEERKRMKKEYEKSMRDIDKIVFHGVYDVARRLEINVKHKANRG